MSQHAIMAVSSMIRKLKYHNNAWKPGLYKKKLKHGIAFLDHRDIGGDSVQDQASLGPMFYSFPTDSWEHNREVSIEQLKFATEGLKYRISIISEIPLVGENDYQDGYCKVCGKDFQSDGLVCSKECNAKYNISNIIHNNHCKLCGKDFASMLGSFNKISCTKECAIVYFVNYECRHRGEPVMEIMKFLGLKT